ncbi:MAG: hypothetical protein ACO3SO_07090 [Luteolibacter sp.]
MIAADAVVPLKMDAGGTAGDPAQQLIGSTAGYAYAAAGTVMLGSFSSSYNQLRLDNAGRMTIEDGFNFDMRGNNSRLSAIAGHCFPVDLTPLPSPASQSPKTPN